MKELSGVVSCKRLLRMSLIGCVLAVPSAVSVWAQDADQVTAADVANEQLKFTRVNPKAAGLNGTQQAMRSEERRVGKECRWRRSRDECKKKENKKRGATRHRSK